jgi:hypothetical protein
MLIEKLEESLLRREPLKEYEYRKRDPSNVYLTPITKQTEKQVIQIDKIGKPVIAPCFIMLEHMIGMITRKPPDITSYEEIEAIEELISVYSPNILPVLSSNDLLMMGFAIDDVGELGRRVIETIKGIKGLTIYSNYLYRPELIRSCIKNPRDDSDYLVETILFQKKRKVGDKSLPDLESFRKYLVLSPTLMYGLGQSGFSYVFDVDKLPAYDKGSLGIKIRKERGIKI